MAGVVAIEEDELLILSVKPTEDELPVRFEELHLVPFGPENPGENWIQSWSILPEKGSITAGLTCRKQKAAVDIS